MSGEGSSFSTTTLHRLLAFLQLKRKRKKKHFTLQLSSKQSYGNLPKSHFKNVIDQFDCDDICITTVDSDITIHSLYFQSHFPAYAHFFENRNRNQTAHSWISKEMSSKIGIKCCDALPVLHAFTCGMTIRVHFMALVKSKHTNKCSNRQIS